MASKHWINSKYGSGASLTLSGLTTVFIEWTTDGYKVSAPGWSLKPRFQDWPSAKEAAEKHVAAKLEAAKKILEEQE